MTEVLERHEAFWSYRDVDRPLIGLARWPRDPMLDLDWGFPEGEGELFPDMIDVERLVPQFEALFARGPGLWDCDFLWPCLPTRSVPWLEAIAGARVFYSNTQTSKSLFSTPYVSDWSDPPRVGRIQDNPWFRKLEEFVRGLAQLSGGRFPIAVPSPHGPWDIVGAVRSMTDLYLDMYDSPGPVMSFAERCAALWIEFNRLLEALVPPWQGGYVGFFGLWAPGYTPVATNDMSVSVSVGQYAEIMLPADRLHAAAWRHTLFHTHSGGAHLLESMLDFLDGGRAVQVVLDPNGPALPKMLPILRRIQERRVPLHVHAYSWADIDALASSLLPTGLALTMSAELLPRGLAGRLSSSTPTSAGRKGIPSGGRESTWR